MGIIEVMQQVIINTNEMNGKSRLIKTSLVKNKIFWRSKRWQSNNFVQSFENYVWKFSEILLTFVNLVTPVKAITVGMFTALPTF